MTFIADPGYEAFQAAIATKEKKDGLVRQMEKNRVNQGLSILRKNLGVFRKAVWTRIKCEFGLFPLRSMEIAVGYECNFKCSQCSCALNHDSARQRLGLDEFKFAIDQALAMGAFQFNLNGGEPQIYYSEVLELCRYISSRGGYVHMATNGYLLTRERLLEMREAGLKSFEMGLDSSVPSVHDENRCQEGSFAKIMENIGTAKELGVTVMCNTIGSKDKIHSGDLIRTVDLSEEMDIMLMITPPCVTGRWAGKLDILLDEDEKWYIRWILATHPKTRIDNYNGLRGLSCPAAREKVAVNPYGDVVSCPLIQIVYGNLREEPLRAIHERMLQDRFYHKGLRDGCLPSHDLDFIKERLLQGRDRADSRD